MTTEGEGGSATKNGDVTKAVMISRMLVRLVIHIVTVRVRGRSTDGSTDKPDKFASVNDYWELMQT